MALNPFTSRDAVTVEEDAKENSKYHPDFCTLTLCMFVGVGRVPSLSRDSELQPLKISSAVTLGKGVFLAGFQNTVTPKFLVFILDHLLDLRNNFFGYGYIF